MARPRRFVNAALGYHATWRGASAIALFMWVIAGGCGTHAGAPAAPVAPASPAPPLAKVTPVANAGEQFVWSVSVHGVEVGHARLALGSRTDDGVNLITTHGDAAAAGVVAAFMVHAEEFVSSFDATDGTPHDSDGVTDTNDKHIRVHGRFDIPHHRVELEISVNDKPPQRSTRMLPTDAPTFDIVDSMLIIRGWDAPVGTRARMYTLGGQRLWLTEIEMAPAEIVDTPMGRVHALRVDGVSRKLTTALKLETRSPAPRHFVMWFTADARHLPVLLVGHTELGDVSIRLVSYTAAPTAER